MGGYLSHHHKKTVAMHASNAQVTFIAAEKCVDMESLEIEIDKENVRILELISKLKMLRSNVAGESVSTTTTTLPADYGPAFIALAYKYMEVGSIEKTLKDQKLSEYVDTTAIFDWRIKFDEIKRRIKVCQAITYEEQEKEINDAHCQCVALLKKFGTNPVFMDNCLATGNIFKEFCLIYISIALASLAYSPRSETNLREEFQYMRECVERFRQRVVKYRLGCVFQNPLKPSTFEDKMRDDIELLVIPIVSDGTSCIDPVDETELKIKAEKEAQLQEYRIKLETLYSEYFNRIIDLIFETEGVLDGPFTKLPLSTLPSPKG